MSLDRYYAISQPLRYIPHRTNRLVSLSILAIQLVSGLVTFPALAMSSSGLVLPHAASNTTNLLPGGQGLNTTNLQPGGQGSNTTSVSMQVKSDYFLCKIRSICINIAVI